MNLVNVVVKHKVFGKGIIIKQNDRYITVKFENKEVNFVFNDCFKEHLVIEDKEIQRQIIEETNDIKHVEKLNDSNYSKPNIYFVFQGKSFDTECNGGYIWAPILNKVNDHMHYWDRLIKLRSGDIILHSSNGYINAISEVCDKYFECEIPKELLKDVIYNRKGRMVKCKYVRIYNP